MKRKLNESRIRFNKALGRWMRQRRENASCGKSPGSGVGTKAASAEASSTEGVDEEGKPGTSGTESEASSRIKVSKVRKYVELTLPSGAIAVRVSEPCSGCSKAGTACIVPRSSRNTICLACKQKKTKCSVKGVINRLVATGELGSIQEAMNLNISSKEDVMRLGLERGAELVMIQLLSLERNVNDRLEAIEAELRRLKGGKASVEAEEAAENEDGSETYEDWNGWESQP